MEVKDEWVDDVGWRGEDDDEARDAHVELERQAWSAMSSLMTASTLTRMATKTVMCAWISRMICAHTVAIAVMCVLSLRSTMGP